MRLWAIFCTLMVAQLGLAQEETRLLRFPTIHDKTIVFVYAGNLYSVSSDGGIARRLTSHEGFEMFPRFSPDGKTIAFSGQYDGNTEVYTMPAQGGTPKRLTYTPTLGRDEIGDRMGPNNIVMGWKHNGKEILFRSRMGTFNDFVGQLYTISTEGGLPEALPLPRGGFASYSPDDSKLVYNRIFREFRTWKRYQGGMADEVWIHDFATKKTEPVTNYKGQDIIPMWAGDKIYYISDNTEKRRYNLFSYDTKSKKTEQLTKLDEYDIKFPSLGDKAIVFEYGGWIYTYDLETKQYKKVTISISEDSSSSRGGLKDISKQIGAFEVSHDGKRALFSARGELFTVPNGTGITRNLSRTSGVHERNPKWSPDGKSIAYISDATGEDEIHLIPHDGSAPATVLTSGGDTYKYELQWSPDSKKIAWTDRKQRLQYLDLATKNVTVAAQAKAFEISGFNWSSDSKWLTWSQSETDSLSKVHLYSLATGKDTEVTDGFYGASQPTFSSDGKYLFFVSARDFTPTYGQTEFNHIYQDMSRIYFVTLAKSTENPFKPKLEEVTPVAEPAKEEGPKPKEKDEKKEPKKDEKKEEKKDPKKDEGIKVDLDGIQSRVLALNVPASNYRGLEAAQGLLYYSRAGRSGPGGFFAYDVAGNKEISLGQIDGYEISADGKKMIASKGGNYGIIDLPRAPFEFKNLDLSGLEVQLDREAEWKQIFAESWRQMRDFFYDPNLHGVEWLLLRKKYEVLLPYVRHRNDLTYIIGEMISELNAGHAYVGGGELPEVKKIPLGLLGAKLKVDPATKAYQIIKILKGANWSPTHRSPLTEMGVEVSEGEFIIAINGIPTKSVGNINELLINKVGKPTVLTISKTADGKNSKQVTVTPIADEGPLNYLAWVEGNREKVAKATNGKVGYLHIPDMLAPGLNEFIKSFYPQITKKGMIIDVRGNGGGNVSPQIIERLRRQIAMFSYARNSVPNVEPGGTFYGPMVALINEYSASDGDLFPWRFKHYKLGTLIGKRSWGGVIGIRGTLPLLDGGTLNRPEFSRFDIAGKEWIIEGYGVDPDIVVDNDPATEYAGTDEQLNKAIEVILEKLKTEEKTIPPVPPFPKR
jgi:tricorn protease